MPTFTALTTLEGRDPAYALGEAMERLGVATATAGTERLLNDWGAPERGAQTAGA